MSDGALSQEEIDSLLAGLDGGSGSPASTAASGRQGSALSAQDAQAFKAILESTLSAQSQNLSMITGLPVTIQSPTVDGSTRDGFLRDVPEEVLTVSVPFAGSLPGDHSFVMSKAMAIRIASLANKDFARENAVRAVASHPLREAWELYTHAQFVNRQLGLTGLNVFFEGILLKQVASKYPIQLVDAKREFKDWAKYKWS